MKIVSILLFVSIGFINYLSANEIVVNKKGESIILNDDGTWELLKTDEKEEGKIVFLIKNAIDTVNSYQKLNDMDEFSHYTITAGCRYVIEVQNRTNFRIKINSFFIHTNKQALQEIHEGFFFINKFIEPGMSRSFSDKDQGYIQKLLGDFKKLPTIEKEKLWKSQYGCEAQKKSVFIRFKNQFGSDVAISKDSGITDATMHNFVIGSKNGVYPLKRKIDFDY